MTTAEQYDLRVDARAQLETELLVPLFVVLSLAVIILFSLNRIYPEQFIMRWGVFIPWWMDLVAYLVLVCVACLYVQRPGFYEITDDGIDIVYQWKRYRITYPEIKEVATLGERVARPLDEALLGGTWERIAHGLRLAVGIFNGKKIVPLPAVELNLTTCDIGGLKIVCIDGRTATLTPAALSAFLNEVERQLRKNGIEASVIRETRVQIGRKDASNLS